MELVVSSIFFTFIVLGLTFGLSCLIYACLLPAGLSPERKMEVRIEFAIFSAGSFAMLAVMLFAMCYH
ncbi:hypothetical protein [Alkalimonas amylolytica]|uniref:Uncharacterized protein n=1 Tax=Alkalimonas amylolytica TaxID=152573 RepID=A0A1H3XXM2_ALKAM|nr:hypothetical protein [Alkalimonas amylolytica]SEA03272.1 hypothetical protein SAMN04488051_101411 [Alkalimonas amylolytica]